MTTDSGKRKEVNCEKVQKTKRHTSAITARLQVKLKTFKFKISEFYIRMCRRKGFAQALHPDLAEVDCRRLLGEVIKHQKYI